MVDSSGGEEAYCVDCGTSVARGINFCPNCGTENPTDPEGDGSDSGPDGTSAESGSTRTGSPEKGERATGADQPNREPGSRERGERADDGRAREPTPEKRTSRPGRDRRGDDAQPGDGPDPRRERSGGRPEAARRGGDPDRRDRQRSQPTDPGREAPAETPGGPRPMLDRSWNVNSRKQLLTGLKAGVYSMVTGYVATTWLTVFTVISAISNPQYSGGVGGPSANQLAGGAVAVINAASSPLTTIPKFVGWLFYSAHFVPLTIDSGARTSSVNLLGSLSVVGVSSVPFRLVAILFLVAFGYRAAASRSYDSLPQAAGAGASVAAGYLALGVPLALLIGVSTGPVSVGPGLLTTVLFMGGFAAVFGGLGGVLRESRRPG